MYRFNVISWMHHVSVVLQRGLNIINCFYTLKKFIYFNNLIFTDLQSRIFSLVLLQTIINNFFRDAIVDKN